MLKVSQVSIGRFHHFHLARQLEKHGLLDTLYTGYPRFKLNDEPGIPFNKIHTFPWLHAPYMARGLVGLHRFAWLNRDWAWWAHETLDLYVASKLKHPAILIALSGLGLHAGRIVQGFGGIHICDRGSSHIRTQEALLAEEYQRYGARWPGIDPRTIVKEEAEYDQANFISVPSQFCYDSFLAQGVPPTKLLKIPYGSRLQRFYPEPIQDRAQDEFRILFVGAAGPRKGFIDLLKAFELFRHPAKRLLLIGSMTPEAEALLRNSDQSRITILGSVPNHQLRQHYSQASVFLLPSIEEGLAMVIGEAMACGCPVIATSNTGAAELITDGVEGFIVPIHSPKLIADRLQQLADDPNLCDSMSNFALKRVTELGGWDSYGVSWASILDILNR